MMTGKREYTVGELVLKSHVYGYVYVYTPRLHVYKKLLNAAALFVMIKIP